MSTKLYVTKCTMFGGGGEGEVKIQIYPKRPQKVRRSALDTRIFSCVENIVGNIAYYRHILLIFQK